jgi:hypothetical protein
MSLASSLSPASGSARDGVRRGPPQPEPDTLALSKSRDWSLGGEGWGWDVPIDATPGPSILDADPRHPMLASRPPAEHPA